MFQLSEKIGIVGTGAWGTALLHLMKQNLEKIHVFSRKEGIDAHILEMDILVLAIPVQQVRSFFNSIPCSSFQEYKPSLVICSKGIEYTTGKLLHEVAAEFLPQSEIAVLFGPNFAREVLNNMPSGAVIAASTEILALKLKKIFTTQAFSIETSNDIAGLEICSAMKNVYAIGAGIISALGFQENTRAIFLTKAIAEMRELLVMFGAKAETIDTAAGVGDLILSCCSTQSRNMSLGMSVVRNNSEISHETCEGYHTAKCISQIKSTYNTPLPIASCIYEILFNNTKPESILKSLRL